MFGTKPADANVFAVGKGDGGTQLATTLIAHGVKVEGEFTSQGDVAIEGEVSGTVNCTGALMIGAEAKIKADIKANDVVVAGIVEGNITASRRIELKSSAKVTGDITCEVIMVENGAALNGRVSSGKRLVEVQTGNTKRPERAPGAV